MRPQGRIFCNLVYAPKLNNEMKIPENLSDTEPIAWASEGVIEAKAGTNKIPKKTI